MVRHSPVPKASNETIYAGATFAQNDNYWQIVPDIENVERRHHPYNDAVFDALLSGELDMAMGIGVVNVFVVLYHFPITR
jgi:hypothetical protein